MIEATRRMGILLTLVWAPFGLSSGAHGAAGAGKDEAYVRVEFNEIASNPRSYDGRRVCVKGGWIRHGILVNVNELNRPYQCLIEVEKFSPETIEDAAQQCIRNYGRHIYPRIELRHVPSDTGIKPEACVIVCGVFKAEFDPVEHIPQPLDAETIRRCE